MGKKKIKSKSKNWNKISNLITGLKTFKKLSTNSILEEKDIEKELKTYEDKYYIRDSKNKNNSKISKEKNFVNFSDPLKKEFFQLSLKESAFQIIIK